MKVIINAETRPGKNRSKDVNNNIDAVNQIIDKLYEAMRQNGIQDTGVIADAVRLAKSAFSETPQGQGGRHIIRCISAAQILAEIAVDCSVIAAAIYLGLVKENSRFIIANDPEYRLLQVSDLANEVIILENKYKEAAPALEHDEHALDILVTYIKSGLRPFSALLIKAAECLAYISDINTSDSKKTDFKLEETEYDYLPLFKESKLKYFLDRIDDQTLRITEPELYRSFLLRYEKLYRQNEKQIAALKEQVENCYNEFKEEVRMGHERPMALLSAAFMRVGEFCDKDTVFNISVKKYTPNEVYRLIRQKTGDANSTADMIDKYTIPICDINIIVDGYHKTSKDTLLIKLFYECCMPKLLSQGYVITKFLFNYRANRFVIDVRDRYNNTICLCIAFKKDHLRYLFSDAKEIPIYAKTIRHNDSDAILLYKRNGEPFNIEKGATVLDAAFRIGIEIGLTAKEAVVNGEKAGLYDTLADGDHVEIIADTKRINGALVKFVPHFRLAWLEHVVTLNAKHYIVKALENRYGERNVDKMREFICRVERKDNTVIYKGYTERRYAEENGITHLTVIIAAFVADGEHKGKLIVHNRRDKQIAKGLPCPSCSFNLFGGHCNPPDNGDADFIGKEVTPEFLMQNTLRELSEEMLLLSAIDDDKAVKAEDRSQPVTNIIYANPFPFAEKDLIPIGFTEYHHSKPISFPIDAIPIGIWEYKLETESEISFFYALPVKGEVVSSLIAADDCINSDGTRSTIALPVSLKSEKELRALYTEKNNDIEICNAITRIWEKENMDVYNKLMKLLQK